MSLGQIFGLLALGIILFAPFVIIFHPRVKDKLKNKK